MSPELLSLKRAAHPADRLHVSNIAYKERFVKSVAARLAERHSATIPHNNTWTQDSYATWVKVNFERHEIADVVKLVQSEIPSNESIYRRGRPVGSKNRYKSQHTPAAPATTWEAEIGLTEEPTATPQTLTTPQPSAIQTAQVIDFARVLADYVKRPELEAVRAMTLNNLGRLDNDIERLDTRINNIIELRPTIVTIERKELPAINLGVQHKAFPLLLATCNTVMRNGLRIIPWVYGPAGTGKSIGAENVAKALGLQFYAMGTTLVKFEVLGFINTSGYQTTPFRQAYEFGGVFCGDEMDSWAKEATVALNNALANGECAFPDRTVKRHKDFIMIACANTVGAGATMDYVGRNKQDGATLNRFAFINWAHDDALEDSLIANKDWLTYVRHVRARVITSGINPKPLVTMRASLFGEALLANGIERDTVIEMTLRQGLSDAQWRQIA